MPGHKFWHLLNVISAVTTTDLHLKSQIPYDLREIFSSIYRYDKVVNVNSTPRNPSSRSLSDILLQFLPENQNPYQVEHTNKNIVGKRSFFKIRKLSELNMQCASPTIWERNVALFIAITAHKS